MSYMTLSLDQRLKRAQMAILNTLDDTEMLALLTPFGYDQARMEEGRDYYDAAQELHHSVATERGEKLGASADVADRWGAARVRLADDIALARIALRDNRGARATLRLDERRENSQARWIIQARQFYQRALADPNVVAAMSRFGTDQASLQEGLDKVNAFEEALRVRRKEDGDAQDATYRRNEAMSAMDQWVRDFRDVAKIALRDRPQLLERLGFMVRGST